MLVVCEGKHCTLDRNGAFECCGGWDVEGIGHCSTAEGPLPPEKHYLLRCTITCTRDTHSVIPLEVGVTSAPDCQV